MPRCLTCAICNKEFKITSEVSEDEIEGCTFDCPHCDALLLMRDGIVKDFHKTIHEDCPAWPVDGKGTNVLKFIG